MRIEINKNRYNATLISLQAILIKQVLCEFGGVQKFERMYEEGKENFSSDFEIAHNNIKIGKVVHDFAQGFIEFIPYKN